MPDPLVAQEKAPADPGLGLYVHVPFCASTCDFCAFYQIRPVRGDFEAYLAASARERVLLPRNDRTIGTVFWGGGTPGLLPPWALEELGAGLGDIPGFAPAEWSVELAPASVRTEKLKVLRGLGVTRISLGVQSFNPGFLDGLGRQHTRRQILRAWDKIRAENFSSVNLDLMIALPGQSREDLIKDLETAASLEPDHISTYCLTFEEDTPLYVKLSNGRVGIDPDREADLYRETWSFLEAGGFRQYEIANFARPGHECLHNLNTWRMGEWEGIGPAAASQRGGWRFQNPADLKRWREEVDAGVRGSEERIRLSPEDLAVDALVFGLRLDEGVDLRETAARFADPGFERLEDLLDGWVDAGLVTRMGDRIRLTPPGRLLADRIGVEILETLKL